MKQKLCILITVLIVLFAAYFIGTGFMKCTSVCIGEYSVSPDGREMTVRVFTASSAGSVRKITVRQKNGETYLDCYAAFGGFNGSIGAKTQYTFPLPENAQSILLCRDGGYETVLRKGGTGNWERIG